jgi:hypothetical protein
VILKWNCLWLNTESTIKQYSLQWLNDIIFFNKKVKLPELVPLEWRKTDVWPKWNIPMTPELKMQKENGLFIQLVCLKINKQKVMRLLKN